MADDVTEMLIREICEELKECSGQLYPVKADITRDDEIQAAFRWVERRLGGVDILVNNAGMSMKADIVDCKLNEWKKIFDLNVFALGACSREAIRSMRSRRVVDGHIININSIASHRVSLHPGNYVYNASKHASRVITECLRRELVEAKSRIKVTSVSPGLVDTNIFEVGGWRENLYSSNTCLQAKDIADAVNYILSTPTSVKINEIIVRTITDGI